MKFPKQNGSRNVSQEHGTMLGDWFCKAGNKTSACSYDGNGGPAMTGLRTKGPIGIPILSYALVGMACYLVSDHTKGMFHRPILFDLAVSHMVTPIFPDLS